MKRFTILIGFVSSCGPLHIDSAQAEQYVNPMTKVFKSLERIEQRLNNMELKNRQHIKALGDLKSCYKRCEALPHVDGEYRNSDKANCYESCQSLEPSDYVSGC